VRIGLGDNVFMSGQLARHGDRLAVRILTPP
jgi:hypothetical protein